MKQTIKLNESQLRSIIKESIQKVLNESFGTGKFSNFDLAKKFAEWALNGDADRQRRVGGPVNAVEAMHDYYYNDNDEQLYRAAEAFSEVSGDNVDEVFEAAKYAAQTYFYYNPNC